ncbi:hypothetical protein [Cryptosporangium arvum]|nr:hypothetical protein [Cryptosporangium arvum]
MNYLVDTSALVRIISRQVDESWLTIADAKNYETVARMVPQLKQERITGD